MEPISAAKVRIWHIRLPDVPLSADAAILSADELSRAGRFVQGHHAARFMTARAALRRILGQALGLPPEALILEVDAHDKPVLKQVEAAPWFNVSHCEDMAVVALCREARVGVDIEFRRPIEANLVERFFSAAEQAALARLPADQWLHGFYRCWTRKEAFVKGLGQGLSLPLDAFDVSLAEPPVLLRCDFAPVADWTLAALDLGEAYEAVVAVEARGAPVVIEPMPRLA